METKRSDAQDFERLFSPKTERYASIAGWIAVWSYICIALLVSLGAPMGELDDGIPLLSARMVHQGMTPAVDFWSFYPPALYFLLNAGFKFLGQTALLTRLLGWGLFILFLFIAGRFFRRQFPLFRSLMPWIMLLFAVIAGPFIGYPFWMALALSGMSLFLYLGIRETSEFPKNGGVGRGVGRDLEMAASGLLAGLSLLLRVNFGLYIAAVVFLDLLIIGNLGDRAHPADGYRNSFRNAALFGGALVLSNVAFYAPAYGANTRIVFEQCVVAAHAYMQAFGFLRFEPGSGLIVIVWPLAWLTLKLLADEGLSRTVFVSTAMTVAAAGFALALRGHPEIATVFPALEIGILLFWHRFVRRLGQAEICLLVFYACVMHYFLTRADAWHQADLRLCAAMLLPFLVFARRSWRLLLRYRKVAGILLTSGAIGLVTVSLVRKPVVTRARVGAERLITLITRPGVSDGQRLAESAPSGPWADIAGDPDESDALRFIRSVSPITEPIYVGRTDHSSGLVNSVRFYWLSDRPVVIRHPVLDAGTMEAPGQRGIIADLVANQIRYAVLIKETFRGTETPYVGSTLLDDYFRDHYRNVAQFGDVGVFLRKG